MTILSGKFSHRNTSLLYRHIAGSSTITAIAHVDNYSMKPIDDKAVINIMLLIQPFPPRIMRYIKTVNEKTIFVFAVDKWVFERDIEIGLLGEAIAGKIIYSFFRFHIKPIFHFFYAGIGGFIQRIAIFIHPPNIYAFFYHGIFCQH